MRIMHLALLLYKIKRKKISINLCRIYCEFLSRKRFSILFFGTITKKKKLDKSNNFFLLLTMNNFLLLTQYNAKK